MAATQTMSHAHVGPEETKDATTIDNPDQDAAIKATTDECFNYISTFDETWEKVEGHQVLEDEIDTCALDDLMNNNWRFTEKTEITELPKAPDLQEVFRNETWSSIQEAIDIANARARKRKEKEESDMEYEDDSTFVPESSEDEDSDMETDEMIASVN